MKKEKNITIAEMIKNMYITTPISIFFYLILFNTLINLALLAEMAVRYPSISKAVSTVTISIQALLIIGGMFFTTYLAIELRESKK